MNTENKQKRPKYTLEFKKDAAKLVIEKGYTQEQAANNPGISKSALSRWVRAEQGHSNGSTGNYVRKINSCAWSEKYYKVPFRVKKTAVFFAKELQ
jgi:transposase